MIVHLPGPLSDRMKLVSVWTEGITKLNDKVYGLSFWTEHMD